MICKDKKRGTYYVKYYQKNNAGKLVSTTKRGFLDKASAKRFELEVSKVKSPITFKDMFKEWLEGLNCSQEEKNNRLSYMERFITFKDKKLENITKANLTYFRNEFQKNEYLHPTTKNRILGHIKAVYNYAYEVYDIKNISTVIKLYPNEKQEKEVITLEEFNKMIEFEKNPIIYAFFYTAYWTGCRRGELRALYKEDLNDHMLVIKRTMRLTESSVKVGTKTSSLIKKVALDDDTYNLLLPLAKREGVYLFGDDTPLSNETLRRHLKSCLKQADINKNITIHSLRHSHGSLLLSKGVDIATVSKRLGHSSITTTIENYIHVLDDEGKTVINMIDKIKNTQ